LSALAAESGVQPVDLDMDVTTLDVRPYGYQWKILDELSAECEVYGQDRSLVVMATGTGKTVLAALYAQRWEFESTLDEIETHRGGRRFVLRSQYPQGVEQEIYGFLLVHHAIRTAGPTQSDQAGSPCSKPK
jgi:hypothetical protein